MRHLLVLLAVLCGLARAVAAQCADGSPPPCGGRRAPTAAAIPALSVAVLTFDNLTRDSADTYLTEGLANDISAQLAQIERLSVTSRSMVRRVSASRAAPPALGRSLNTAYLVTGGIQRGGARIRVSVELVRAATAQTVWSNQFDRVSSDLLSMQQEIATNVASGIAGRLLPAERVALASAPMTNAAAYDHILRADFLFSQRNPESADRALNEYEAATRLDPRSDRAFAGLGRTWGLCSDWGFRCRGMSSESLVVFGHRAVAEAFAINPRSAEAFAARASLNYDHLPDSALADAERAIALDPRSPNHHQLRGWILADMFLRLDEALAEYRLALALDPARAITWEHVARVLTVQQRFPEALAALDSAIAIEPTFLVALNRRGVLRAFLGDSAGARRDLEPARLRIDGRFNDASLRAFLAARRGDSTTAGRLVDSLSAARAFGELHSLTLLQLRRTADWITIYRPRARLERLWEKYPWYDPIRGDAAFIALLAGRAP